MGQDVCDIFLKDPSAWIDQGYIENEIIDKWFNKEYDALEFNNLLMSPISLPDHWTF